MSRARCCTAALLYSLTNAPLRAAVAPAAEPSATILVIPFARNGDAPEWLSFALAQGLEDRLAQDASVNFLSLKQLDAVLRRRDIRVVDASDPAVAVPIARALGASDVVVGDVRKVGERYFVGARRIGVLQKRSPRILHLDAVPEQLPAMPDRLAARLFDLEPVGAVTSSAAAFESAARCAMDLVRLPLGPRAPAKLPVPGDDVEKACRAAIAADPALGLAHAGLSVILAAKGDTAGARREAALGRVGPFVPFAWLADSSAVRRAGDAAAARRLLQEAVAQHPGFLHARGYVLEDMLEGCEYEAALQELDAYLARVPGHPWALAMKGKAQARLGRLDDAVASSRLALQKDPGDPEILVELASRLIDAKKLDEAEGVLREALSQPPIRPLALLRIGYVHLLQKKLPEARKELEQALKGAWREDEARTRGYAHMDLARVAALEGKPDEAVQRLAAAKAEGSPRALPCGEADLASLAGREDFRKLCPEGAK